MDFTAKITNLSDRDLEGIAILELLDAITMEPLDIEFKNDSRQKAFLGKAGAEYNCQLEDRNPGRCGCSNLQDQG